MLAARERPLLRIHIHVGGRRRSAAHNEGLQPMMLRLVFSHRLSHRRLMAGAALTAVLGVPAQDALALSAPCSSPNILESSTTSAAAGTTTGPIESLTVPAGQVTIDVVGAQGGNSGGLGAEVAATFPIASGQTLCVLVGVQGGTDVNGDGGGGGGSFVYAIDAGTCASNLAAVTTGAAPSLLIAAAGGGGSSGEAIGLNGLAPTGPGPAGASAGGTAGGVGGTNGNGGSAVGNGGGGGGGLLTDGGTVDGVPGGLALIHGGTGGVIAGFANGGYGGGGGDAAIGGGGGGYNGGGTGNGNAPPTAGAGGGSFSAAAPLAPYTQSGVQAGNGAVNVCYAPPPPVPALSWPGLALLLGGLLAGGMALLRRRGNAAP